ncbi:MAG: S41 family peptidase [Bacteroidota bacterium]
MKKYWIWLLMLGLWSVACDRYDDDIVPEPEQEQEEEEEEVEEPKTAADFPVQNFMWQAMNAFYFWQQDVPNLADNLFTGPEDPDYVSFLESETDPNAFYESLLFSEDRFSFLSEDYRDLVQSFQGVSQSNGLEFQLFLFQDSDDIFGVVTYVALDSDAASKDIQRGDFFVGVDGQRLNLNNYINLLFGDNATYTLTMASLSDGNISENGEEVTLTKIENFAENPILVSKVLEVQGQKVGYLMYNSFVANYDDQLNDEFGKFAAENVQELVLDLRYNGGGRVSSAVQIASAVYGTNTDELFLRARYNDKLQAQLSEDFLNTNFTDVTFDSNTVLKELNLSRLYVIVTDRTASASELVINGLEPYIDVVLVGTTTVGKNEFSNTFVDDPENSFFYDPSREEFINPDNQWAIQPLLGRNENAAGFSDYTAGLPPDLEIGEDIGNLGALGEVDEPLLARALENITGATSKRALATPMQVEKIGYSKMFSITDQTMLMDGLLKPIK